MKLGSSAGGIFVPYGEKKSKFCESRGIFYIERVYSNILLSTFKKQQQYFSMFTNPKCIVGLLLEKEGHAPF